MVYPTLLADLLKLQWAIVVVVLVRRYETPGAAKFTISARTTEMEAMV